MADIASGFVYAMHEPESVEEARAWLDSVREPALSLEGYAIVIDQPTMLQGQLDCIGYRAQGLDLMRALKARWDTHETLPDML